MMVARLVSLFFLLLSAVRCSAQKEGKRLTIVPFPVVYYAPETRLVGGVASVATFRLRPDSLQAHPSSITGGAAYTQNKQVLLYANFNIFYDAARWYAFGELGYYKYSYKFFGIGQAETPEVLYGVDYPRIKLTATRRVLPHLYSGLGGAYEDYKITDTATAGPLANDAIPGARGSRTAGIGPQLVYDSRDSVLFPTRGAFGTVGWLNSSPTWGADHAFNRYVLDVSFYQKLRPKVVLAVNNYGSFVTGDAPFQQQSLLGGNRRMRGYYEGRYIDKNLAILQSEVRVPIRGRFGAAVFGGVAALGGEEDFLRMHDLKYAGGAGLRFNLVRKDHLNLRLDYAVGQGSSGIYFTVGEAF